MDLTTPAGLRESVRVFRDPATSDTERDRIRHAWAAAGIPNQFAAMIRAADIERVILDEQWRP